MLSFEKFAEAVINRAIVKLAGSSPEDMTWTERATNSDIGSNIIDYFDPENNILTGTLEGMGSDLIKNTDPNTLESRFNAAENEEHQSSPDMMKRRVLTKAMNKELANGPDLTLLERFSNSKPVSDFLDWYSGSLPDQMVNSALSGETDREVFGNIGQKLYDLTSRWDPGVQGAQDVADSLTSLRSNPEFIEERRARRAATAKQRTDNIVAKMMQRGETPESTAKLLADLLPQPKAIRNMIAPVDQLTDSIGRYIRRKNIKGLMRGEALKAQQKTNEEAQSYNGIWGNIKSKFTGGPKVYKPDYPKLMSKIEKMAPTNPFRLGRYADDYQKAIHTLRGGALTPEQPAGLTGNLSDMITLMGEDAGFKKLFDSIYGN